MIYYSNIFGKDEYLLRITGIQLNSITTTELFGMVSKFPVRLRGGTSLPAGRNNYTIISGLPKDNISRYQVITNVRFLSLVQALNIQKKFRFQFRIFKEDF